MKAGWHTNFRRAAVEKRRSAEGHVFDSVGELGRWEVLKLRQHAKEISELRRQVPFPLVFVDEEGEKTPILIRSPGFPNGQTARYTADFTYKENGVFIVEEFKGFDDGDDAAKLRRAVFEAIYGLRVKLSGPAAQAFKRKSEAIAWRRSRRKRS